MHLFFGMNRYRSNRKTILTAISLGILWIPLLSCIRLSELVDRSGTAPAPIEGVHTESKSSSSICSFNIQFLGNSKIRKNSLLADVLKRQNCDLVVIQEIVAPPDLRQIPNNTYYGTEQLPVFPLTGDSWKPVDVVTDFFLAMQAHGFDSYWLSEQDTGPGENNQNNGSATEWWAIFYKSAKWEKALDLPHGFLDGDVTQNPDWDRVPYAFSVRHKSQKADFVLINVHLRPGADKVSAARRQHELQSIKKWIDQQKEKSTERDFIVLGDNNIENNDELMNLDIDLTSLNTEARIMTNTNINGLRPYDHVFIDPRWSKEISSYKNLINISLVNELRLKWLPEWGDYPGGDSTGVGYNHNLFRFNFSDHNPIKFEVSINEKDDD